LFDVILLHCLTENKFVKVPDEILIRNAYNLNVNHISSICDIPIIKTFYAIHYAVICDENRLPVQADDKHLLLVEKTCKYIVLYFNA